MRRALIIAGVFVSLFGLSGCRVFDKLTKEKEKSPAEPASRNRDPNWLRERQDREGRPPADWLARPETPGRGARVPSGDTASDNRNPASRILSGFLEDSDGKPIGGGYIKVENADPVKAGYGAPMGVESLRDGTFEIQGLIPGEHYSLSCQMAKDGRTQAGRVIVQVPKSQIHLRLQENAQLPPVREGSDLPPTVPPAGSGPKVFDTPKADSADWSPVAPKPAETPPARSDLIANPGNAAPWKPPAANIPGPGAAPPIPPLVPGPTSKSMPKNAGLSLLDESGKRVNVLSGRPEDLLLLDFLTSNCKPCKLSIPALTAFHGKYGRRMELIGVLCDEEKSDRKTDLANRYKTDNRLPYAVLADDGTAAQDAFNIEFYPTLVLLDGTGRRLWKGHPKNLNEVEAILRNR